MTSTGSVGSELGMLMFLTGFLAAESLALVGFGVGLAGFFISGVGFLASRTVSPSIDLFLLIIYNYNMSIMKLTKKQLAVLQFIEDFEEEKGYSPSYREIMAGLELSSVSAVAEHIDNLVGKGVLKKNPGEARSLEVLDYRHEKTVELFKAKMLSASEGEREVLEKAAEILGIDLA